VLDHFAGPGSFHPECGSHFLSRLAPNQQAIVGMVIWVTGLSGSGKTTLCAALYALLKPRVPHLVKLDGDEIRAAFGDDLGHAEKDRVRQIQRIQRISRMLAGQGLAVLVAALYAHPDLLAWNRSNLPGYFEIYLKADLAFLRQRDSKGLYGKAERGAITDVVGVDIPWHAPERPDRVIDAVSAGDPDRLALSVARSIPAMSGLLVSEAGGVPR
jgi:adenylylsulfate kinase-like enzyme